MAKYRGWAELEEASYLSDLFQQIVADCRVSSRAVELAAILRKHFTITERLFMPPSVMIFQSAFQF